MELTRRLVLTTEQVVQILQNSEQNTFEAVLTQQEDSTTYTTPFKTNSPIYETVTTRTFKLDIECAISRVEFNIDGTSVRIEGEEIYRR